MADGCATLHFNLVSAHSMNTRRWDIRAVQYVCGDTMSGPENCLQYFTGTTGSFRSFNYPSNFPTTTTTHLSNQDYAICIRRDASACYICYGHFLQDGCNECTNQLAEVETVVAGPTFGISVTNAGGAKANVDTHCSLDYLMIPGGHTEELAQEGTEIQTYAADALMNSVCTRQEPFYVWFHTDDDELTNAAGGETNDNELVGFPPGTQGFHLKYVQ